MSIRKHNIFIIVIFSLFVFQSVLERVWNGFSYLDELVAIIAVLYAVLTKFNAIHVFFRKNHYSSLIMFSVFLLCGLLGNLIYHYQPWGLVLQDFLVNIKFFLSIFAGYCFFIHIKWDQSENVIRSFSIICSYILFAVFIIDRVLNIFGGQVRYGIRSAVLFYPHSTYLAGALAFLLVCLAMTYKKKCNVAIILDLLVVAMTLRSKAIVAAVAYVFMFWLMIIRKKKLKVWQIVIMGGAGIIIAWSQIDFYFLRLAGASARSILLLTSFVIMKDYFPIGVGFGTYASHAASVQYSPVYVKYGFNKLYDVSSTNPDAYLDDTFWPIVFGQTGVLGTLCYIYVLIAIARRCFTLRKIDKRLYMSTLFVLVYLLVSSMAEPIFNNSIAIPLGFCIGIAFSVGDKQSKGII